MSINFPELVQELSINLQQPLMEPIEDACRISWDNVDMHIYLHSDGEEEMLVICLDIADMPSGLEEHLSLLMLQGNYLWIASNFATLSMNLESKKLALCDKLPEALLDADKLTERVKELHQTALYWQEIIADKIEEYKRGEDNFNNDGIQDALIKV